MQDREFSKAFNNEDVTDESVGNEVSLTAAEGMSDDDTGAVVIDAKTAVNDAAEEAGIDTSAGQPDLIAEAAAEGETVAEEQAEQLSPICSARSLGKAACASAKRNWPPAKLPWAPVAMAKFLPPPTMPRLPRSASA